MNRTGFLSKFLSVFFPERCPYCGRVLEKPAAMCESCKGQLKIRRFPVFIGEELLCFSPLLYEGVAKRRFCVLSLKTTGNCRVLLAILWRK